MKDLKHLSYFESLLQDSGNELTGNARWRYTPCRVEAL